MQIKEFEALTLKECLKLVRSAMGPDAVILETRKFRKGGLMGMGAHDAVAIVAATGITVDSDKLIERAPTSGIACKNSDVDRVEYAAHTAALEPERTEQSAQVRASAVRRVAARGMYGAANGARADSRSQTISSPMVSGRDAFAALLAPGSEPLERPSRSSTPTVSARVVASPKSSLPVEISGGAASKSPAPAKRVEPAAAPRRADDIPYLERAIGEIRECLIALQREQRESHERTVSAVVSAVAPAVSAANSAGHAIFGEEPHPRFPDLQAQLRGSGVSESLIIDLFDQLPEMGAWSEQAQAALAVSAIKDLITRRVATAGPIELTPGRAKVVALIGPTGVGKTTTIAKLAAQFALIQKKRVALLTVDTYRIAAVEQLKTYSQIIGLPVSIGYSTAEVLPILQQYADYDLILIDTAGRSQQHAMQIGELKALLDVVDCETHLVLSAPTKEYDMVDAARRFAAARVDRLIFSKLDETASYGTLLNVADQTGIPISYITTGQSVPEDLEIAESARLADMILA